MGGPRPLRRGEKTDGSENIPGEPAPSRRTEMRKGFLRNLLTSFPEKLRGIVGTVGGGSDTEREEQVHVA